MRRSWRRGLAATAVAGLFLAGCGDGQASDEPSADDQATGDASSDDESADPSLEQDDPDQPSATEDGAQDPNDDIEDGVYRGIGVALPVPDGWSIDPAAWQQGIVVAMPEDGTQQLTAQAIDMEQAEAAGAQVTDFESLLDGVRQGIGQEADADEEVDMPGAERAQRFTYLELPGQQEGQPSISATILMADGGDGLVGEFAYSAAATDYDEATASLLADEAGFDPDSEPTPVPQVPPPPPSGDGTDEPTDGTG